MAGAIIHGRSLSGALELDAEVLVVGSGAAGAVVAATLAEAGQDVIVLEEGAHVTPAEYGKMRPSQTMRHIWRDAGLTFAIGLGDTPMINVMMGRCVGGSSVLTGAVCFRIPGAVLRHWSTELGLTELTEAGMERYHESVERAVHVETVPAHMRSRSTLRFAEGAARLGVAIEPMRRNTKDCHGCGRCNFGCPHGAKMSVDVTYLPRAVAAGARIYSDCAVDRITHEGGRATGVVGRVLAGPRGETRARLRVRARRVVVAAGAYGSPLLLADSGLGRQSGQVGKNLTLHPGFRVMARFDERIEGWKGSLQSMYSDHYERDGITLTSLFVPPGVLAATMHGIGPEHIRRALTIPNLAIFGGMLHDAAGGEIRRGLFGGPNITYRMSAADRAVVPILMRRMAEIFFAGGAREVFLPVLGLGSVDADRLRTIDLEHVPGRKLECASQHPLGTCRMGVSPLNSVVDPDGQSWELRELFVADGSIVPTSLGVNPQVSIMTMAARIADKLRERPLPA
ncbi:MAG: GMC family oxidoreductase [Sorangiineae bacterium]|nr:GMC family oxidoreductase [Polyangiaceae bacterium]MEB2324885.1 GMC family oxidoreductase [Sorangiineae bacterium]